MISFYATLFSNTRPGPPSIAAVGRRLRYILPPGCLLLAGLLGAGCSEHGQPSSLEGQIRGLSGPAEISVKKEHIHYKFSDPVLQTAALEEDGQFGFEFEELETPAVFELEYNGDSHPIYVEPGGQQYISFHHRAFPDLSETRGPAEAYYQAYQQYLDELEEAEQHLRRERQKMREGKKNDVLNIQRLKIQIAKEYLADTPFSFRIDRHLGEFLTTSLEHLNMLYDTQALPPESYVQRRSEVLDMAHRNQFFSRSSLEAQRAGIRDFATIWVDTAPPAGHTGASRGLPPATDELAVKSVALIDAVFEGSAQEQRRREMKWELVAGIQEAAGKRHAAMYLIAEELGEGDFETGRQLFNTHRGLLEAEAKFISFLETLQREVAATRPGQPAVSFTITNENGQPVSLSDFKGQYVLLDFWASWCMPCINALPKLESLYERYDRDDLEIVSISVEENEDLWRSALERFPQPWVQLYDGTGFDQETFRAYRAGSIPYYVLIGRDGTILRNNDFSPGDELDGIIEHLLEEESDNTYAGQ